MVGANVLEVEVETTLEKILRGIGKVAESIGMRRVLITASLLTPLLLNAGGEDEKEQEIVNSYLNNPRNKFTQEQKDLITKKLKEAGKYIKQIEILDEKVAKLEGQIVEAQKKEKGYISRLDELGEQLDAAIKDLNVYKQTTEKRLEEMSGKDDEPFEIYTFAWEKDKDDKNGDGKITYDENPSHNETKKEFIFGEGKTAYIAILARIKRKGLIRVDVLDEKGKRKSQVIKKQEGFGNYCAICSDYGGPSEVNVYFKGEGDKSHWVRVAKTIHFSVDGNVKSEYMPNMFKSAEK